MNHTLSDSQLEAMIKSAVNSSGPLPPDEKFSQLISALRELQERRKAAMESEPVAIVEPSDYVTAAQLVGEESLRKAVRELYEGALRIGDKLYRHAQPAPEYPETLPCPVLLEPGLRFGKGIKTSTMLAALARRAVHESDMAALSSEERAEFQARIEDFKALIAPVVPVVPDEMTIRDACKFVQDMRLFDDVSVIVMRTWNACRAAMLQAGNSPVIPDGLPDGVNIYHGPKEKTILVLKQDAAVNQDCWCRTCRPVTLNDMRFVVCPDCGNKRCPRANDHRNSCTGSNEPGQEGIAYPDTLREVK